MNLESTINLFIDTNILKAEPFYKNEEYESLKILIEKNIIKIYLPYIVENEYLTQLKDPYIKEIKQIISHLNTLKRKHAIDTDKINAYVEEMEKLRNSTLDNINKDFEENFCKKLSVEKLEIDKHHSLEVFKKYFDGLTPFKDIKSRQDLPDGFIFEAILDKKASNTNTVVILKDGELLNACKNNDIFTFTSLKEFIKNENIQKILIDYQSGEESKKKFLKYLEKYEIINDILPSLEISELEGKDIRDYSIPSDNHIANITCIGDIDNINCDFNNPISFGNNKIGIPISFAIEVEAYMFVFKADYYSNDELSSLSCEEWNDHYVSVDKTFLLELDSVVILNITNIDFTNPDIDFDIVVNDVKYELNSIDKIKVLK